jgi:Periplasmic copper-binding protein (NosD)
MSRILGFCLAGLAAIVFVCLTASQALASHVQCGDVIQQDTTLDSDLLGCSFPALTIAGDNVTLDLNGHIIDGGISTVRGHLDPFPSNTSVVVENGTIENGELELSSYDSVTVRHVVSVFIEILNCGTALVERSRVSQSASNVWFAGMSFGRGGDIQVLDNVIMGSFEGVAFGKGTTSGLVARNFITRNGLGVGTSHAGPITLVGNTIRANEGGIGAGQGGNFTAIHNVITDNGNGIGLDEAHATLERNVISGNRENGIQGSLAGLNADHNVISRNGIDGILVGRAVAGTLANNNLDRNGNDGIHVTDFDPNLTISDNHAWFNGNLGIEAPSGTIGSGNWAKHNKDPAQCVPGSLCSTKGKPH